MKNISATIASNNSSSSSPEDLPSKAEGIAWCSAFALEAVLIVVGNLLIIGLFAVNKKLRKKSLFLVVNMAFADLIFGAVSLPLRIYLVWVYYQPWTAMHNRSLYRYYLIIETVSLQASLISAAFMSGERFYAIYWPLKHRTLSMRAYRIVIFVLWTLAIILTTVFIILYLLISGKHAFYVLMSFSLILLFIVCGCNIGIWRKLQHGRVVSQQQNRASQIQRLTKTLLFVSSIVLLSWLPFIILYYLGFFYKVSIPENIYFAVDILNYSNSVLNPVVYTFRISEFRQALGLCCFRRRASMNREGYGRDNRAASVTSPTQLRTFPTDPSHLQLSCEQQVMDTKL